MALFEDLIFLSTAEEDSNESGLCIMLRIVYLLVTLGRHYGGVDFLLPTIFNTVIRVTTLWANDACQR